MTNLTITLPDDLAEIAQEQGLLTTPALEAYIRGNIKVNIDDLDYPSDFPPLLKGKVHPALYRKGKILGDIISPIDVEWEAMK
jgi:hypothetical protein